MTLYTSAESYFPEVGRAIAQRNGGRLAQLLSYGTTTRGLVATLENPVSLLSTYQSDEGNESLPAASSRPSSLWRPYPALHPRLPLIEPHLEDASSMLQVFVDQLVQRGRFGGVGEVVRHHLRAAVAILQGEWAQAFTEHCNAIR
jgi:hypothetical protein